MKYLFLLFLSLPLLASPEMEVAIHQKDHKAIKKLIALGDWRNDLQGTLKVLAREGDEQMLMLFNPSSPEFPGKQFMHQIGIAGNSELLYAFYKYARPSVKGIGLSHFIGKLPIKELAIFRDLTKKDIMSSMHLSLIHEACESKVDRTKKLELLEKIGFTFNEKNKSGINALHYFVANDGKNFECIDFYLKKGVPLNAADKSGRTALHKAHRLETFDYLVTKGAKKDVQDNRGNVPERREIPEGDFFGKERKKSPGKGFLDF